MLRAATVAVKVLPSPVADDWLGSLVRFVENSVPKALMFSLPLIDTKMLLLVVLGLISINEIFPSARLAA